MAILKGILDYAEIDVQTLDPKETRSHGTTAALIGLHQPPEVLPSGQDVEVSFRLCLPCAVPPDAFEAWLLFVLGGEATLDSDNPLAEYDLDGLTEPLLGIKARLWG